MEPYQILGGAEECHSSESGWTMYIGSPIDDDDDDDDDGDNDSRYNNGGTTYHADAEDESDDSMASDASSGPSHHGIIDTSWGNGKGGCGFVDFQQVADDEEEYVDKKESFDKKAKHVKTQEKQIEGKKVEKMVVNGSKGKATSVQGVGKVRKSYWVGKRK